MPNNQQLSITRLIAIPAAITLGVTLLRLAGELQHWGMPWFSSAAGGGGALVGISWLPLIFGPWFAVRLAKTGNGYPSGKRAWGYLALGFAVMMAGGAVSFLVQSQRMRELGILGFVVILAAAFVPRKGWRALGRTLIAYAFAARVPVLIVMFFAMRGNGGAGWGTHYDAIDADLAHLPFASKFLYDAILPQMTFWIAWTVIAGTLAGLTAVAIARRIVRPAAENL